MESDLEITVVSSTDAHAWDSFVRGQPTATLYHTHAWRAIMEAEFHCETHYLCARDGAGSILGVLPLARLSSLLFGDFLVSLPYVNYGGVLATNPEVDAQLTAMRASLAADLRVSHAEFRDRAPRGADWPVRTDKVGMKLELSADPKTQWDCLTTKLRTTDQAPDRDGASAVVGGDELLNDFYYVFSRNMRGSRHPGVRPLVLRSHPVATGRTYRTCDRLPQWRPRRSRAVDSSWRQYGNSVGVVICAHSTNLASHAVVYLGMPEAGHRAGCKVL